MDQKYAKLSLNPPFTPMGSQPTRLLDPIQFNMSLIDRKPPNLKNVPKALPSPPTMALGFKWIEKIKSCRTTTITEVKPIIAPAFDKPPCEVSYEIQSQPDKSYPTLMTEPKCPIPQAKRYHMAVLYL